MFLAWVEWRTSRCHRQTSTVAEKGTWLIYIHVIVLAIVLYTIQNMPSCCWCSTILSNASFHPGFLATAIQSVYLQTWPIFWPRQPEERPIPGGPKRGPFQALAANTWLVVAKACGSSVLLVHCMCVCVCVVPADEMLLTILGCREEDRYICGEGV